MRVAIDQSASGRVLRGYDNLSEFIAELLDVIRRCSRTAFVKREARIHVVEFADVLDEKFGALNASVPPICDTVSKKMELLTEESRAYTRSRFAAKSSEREGDLVRHILVINSSASDRTSVSRTLIADTVQHLLEIDPDAVVTFRDIGTAPVPHLTPATVAGVRSIANTTSEMQSRDLSDELIGELQAADIILIGAPMYNFSIPSTLRAWFDHVLRPRGHLHLQ